MNKHQRLGFNEAADVREVDSFSQSPLSLARNSKKSRSLGWSMSIRRNLSRKDLPTMPGFTTDSVSRSDRQRVDVRPEGSRRVHVFARAGQASEISNFIGPGRATSIPLKDDAAQLKAVIGRSRRLNEFGSIFATAWKSSPPVRSKSYEGARNKHLIVVEQLLPKGIGPLELAFRQLQQKAGGGRNVRRRTQAAAASVSQANRFDHQSRRWRPCGT